jgi:hypothetical protein
MATSVVSSWSMAVLETASGETTRALKPCFPRREASITETDECTPAGDAQHGTLALPFLGPVGMTLDRQAGQRCRARLCAGAFAISDDG